MRRIGRSWLRRIARRLLALRKPQAPGESPTVYLDAVLRSPSARAFAELLTLRQRRKAERSNRRKLPDLTALDPSQRTQELVSPLLAHATTLPARLSLLEEVFVAGGYETAQALADRLEAEVLCSPRATRQRALPLFTRVWITAGEAERARRLWERAGRDLSPDHPWRQALWLSLGALDTPCWHSAHALYPYPAAECLLRGQLQAVPIEQHMAAHPWAVLLNPELDLLLHNARLSSTDSGLGAFNRYLKRHELPAAQARGEAATWLGDLAFSDGPVVRGPLVSVIMSARNAERTVAYAVDSILQQTYVSLELLVADDDSSDATRRILQERYAGDARVRLFGSVQNQGTYNVRNQLIAQARGELITFQDADDLSLPTRIARQVQAIQASGRVGCISEWLRVRPDGSVAFFSNGKAARLSIVSFMAARAALQAVGAYPSAKIGADLDIYRRVLRAYGSASVARLPTPLLLGLWSEGSLTRSALTESLESGYRSPVRRRYSELVFRRDLFGLGSLSDAALTSELRQMGNFVEASELISGLGPKP